MDSGAAVESGTAMEALRRSRPAGAEPADGTRLGLVAVARRHGDTVPSLGATARQHSRPGLSLHTRAKAMRLGAVATVGLEGTLGHRTVLIRESLPYGQVLSIADSVQIRQSRPLRRPARPAMFSFNDHSLARPNNLFPLANHYLCLRHLFARIAFHSSTRLKDCVSYDLRCTSSQGVVQHVFLVTMPLTRCFRLC